MEYPTQYGCSECCEKPVFGVAERPAARHDTEVVIILVDRRKFIAQASPVCIELLGWICPLTPLEIHLRHKAGLAGYEGGFVEHYLIPVLYPTSLTRSIQILLGLLVLSIYTVLYGWIFLRRLRR